MSITVQDCLSLPSLSDAVVAGGAGGLQRIIKRASVLEFATVDDILTDASARGGDAIITALFSIADSVEKQCKMLRILNQGGEACLILFYVGTIVKELSPQLIQTADDLDFPLIVMPYATKIVYSDLIFDITSLLLDSQTSTLNIHDLLDEISKNDISDLSRAMKIIADKFGGSLILTNSNYEPLLVTCAAQSEELISLTAWEDIVKDLKQKDIFSADSGYLFQYDVHGQSANAFFTKIKNHHEGINLLVFDFSNTLNYSDLFGIASIISTFAVVWKYRGDTDENNLVQALLSNNGIQIQFALSKYRMKPDSINNLLILSKPEPDLKHTNQDMAILQADKEIRRIFTNHHVKYFSAAKDSYIIYLPYQVSNTSHLMRDIDSLLQEGTASELMVLFAPNLMGAAHINEIYMMFRECCSVLKTIFPMQRRFDQFSLGFAHSCWDILKNNERKLSAYDDFLIPLDSQRDDALVNTLTIYILDANRSVSTTASLMFTHVNTVQYRIRKIKELLNIELSDISEILFVTQAVAIRRVLQAM